jgi:hypothetical protein
MFDDRDEEHGHDDPMPPTPGLGDGGARPDWLVSAEAGLEAEAKKMSLPSRPAIIKPGEPKPPEPKPTRSTPAMDPGKPILFQMPVAGAASAANATPAAGEAAASPAGWPSAPDAPAGWPSQPPPVAAQPPGAAEPSGAVNPFIAEFQREQAEQAAARSSGAPRKREPRPGDLPADDEVPWVEPGARSRKREIDRSSPFAKEPAGSPGSPPRKPLLQNPIVRIAGAVVALAVLVVGGLQFVPREGQSQVSGTPIREIRKAPESFDGRLVTVSGRVGEIFVIGASHAYYLHDGDDMLLVFTRKGAPETFKKHTVTGTISTGKLEGDPRPSLFERAS